MEYTGPVSFRVKLDGGQVHKTEVKQSGGVQANISMGFLTWGGGRGGGDLTSTNALHHLLLEF